MNSYECPGEIRKGGLMGVSIGAGTLAMLVKEAMLSVESRMHSFKFACANPHSLVSARKDGEFRQALLACDAVVADGVGVTLAAKIVGVDVGPRITGLEFFTGVMQALNRRGGRVFFFGSSDSVLERVQSRCRVDFPNLHVEAFSPPFGQWSELDNRQMLKMINDAKPDVLWVGMTAPKQEKWIHFNADQLRVPVIGAIGAVFQYFAGDVKRAPEWVCKSGFEWLYRLVGEPRRLWRRTVISAPMFVYFVMRERLALLVKS